MRQILRKLLFLILLIGLAGCVTIFGTKRQNVKITSVTPDVSISVGSKTIENDSVKRKIEKKFPYTIKASKDGYKSRVDVLSPEKTSFTILGDIAAAPVMYGLFGLAIDVMFSPVKMRRYKSKYEFPPLKPLPKKLEDEKFIWVQDVIVNIKKGDVLGKYYTSIRKMENDKSYSEYKADEKILYDVPIFQQDMNDILLSYGYSDTSENVIASSWNSLYLTSEIKTLNTNIARLKAFKGVKPKVIFGIEADVEWVLYDGFGNRILETTTKGISDYRWSSIDIMDSKFKRSMKDAIEYAMIDLYANTKFKGLLKFDSELATGGKNSQIELEVDDLSDNAEEIALTDQMHSIVRVLSGGSNYSGTVISNDGYIITSYQAISSNEKLTVEINDEQIQAETINTNAQLNLALLKIESNSIQPIKWNVSNESSVGDRVFTLSFSKLEMLDKYVSSGIISGFRLFQSKPYIQSDVPMSFGNSGGVMLDKKGHILGILNSKANSFGVEGIGFAIPFDDVLTGLNIVIK